MAGPESEHIYGIQLRESANDGSDFSNGDTDYRVVFLGEDGLLHAKDSAGTVTSLSGGNYSSVPWSSGTAMPGAPSTNDRITRTDLNGDWYYNGSIWLSTAHEVMFPLATDPPISATFAMHRMKMPAALGGSDVYLASVLTAYHVASGGTALSASHKWVGEVFKSNSAGNSSLGTITIDSGASGQWLAGTTLAINAAAAVASGYVSLQIVWTKTGTPGNLYANCGLAYRTIAT